MATTFRIHLPIMMLAMSLSQRPLLGADGPKHVDLVKHRLTTSSPYHISYSLSPIPLSYKLQSAQQGDRIKVSYFVYDMYKAEAAKGTFDADAKGASHDFTFQPARYGWYTVIAQAYDKDEFLGGTSLHLGVTPKYPNVPEMTKGHNDGGWNDISRSAFCGLLLDRCNTNPGIKTGQPWDPATTLKNQAEADRCGVTLLVQFEGYDKATPEHVKEVVTACKGKVKYYEIINEPNFRGGPEKYVPVCKAAYETIKSIDPQAQVMGPDVCGMNIGWHKKFYEFGGGKVVDIVSIHDYEGDESIDPGHWRYKVGEIRKIMDAAGDGKKEIWQTERALGGVRANVFLGGCQAVRVTLRFDIMEALGISNEHNYHYYLNTVGYGDVPTYVWSDPTGPHPAAMAMRTRAAVTKGMKFAGELDFGPTGNKMLLGLKYAGTDGSVVMIRNYGCNDVPVVLNITGGQVELIDAFGNSSKLATAGGKATVMAGVMPQYLKLSKGAALQPVKIDFGKNLAPECKFTFTGTTKSDAQKVLTNGLYEVSHAGSPWGPSFQGDMKPLEIALPANRRISRMLVFSVRADNPHSTLLDFDVQAHDGSDWKTVKEVRTPCPPSDIAASRDAAVHTWYNDQNFQVVEFQPVVTSKLRIVPVRSTYGFMTDENVFHVTKFKANSNQNLRLREVEIYGEQ